MFILTFPEADQEELMRMKELFEEAINKKDRFIFANSEYQLYKFNKGEWVEIKNIEVKVKEPILEKLAKVFLKKVSKKGRRLK